VQDCCTQKNKCPIATQVTYIPSRQTQPHGSILPATYVCIGADARSL
jgi:hypothetical protein